MGILSVWYGIDITLKSQFSRNPLKYQYCLSFSNYHWQFLSELLLWTGKPASSCVLLFCLTTGALWSHVVASIGHIDVGHVLIPSSAALVLSDQKQSLDTGNMYVCVQLCIKHTHTQIQQVYCYTKCHIMLQMPTSRGRITCETETVQQHSAHHRYQRLLVQDHSLKLSQNRT